MRILAFTTSGHDISAAAAEGRDLVAAVSEPLARGHAERILPLLREVLVQAGWVWGDIELVAVTLGPGNFTGLRAGLSVARALALALARPTLGLGTLELLAEAAAAAAPANERPIQVFLDARRDEVYAQRFSAGLGPLTEPALLSLARLKTEMPTSALLVGEGAACLGLLATDGHRVIEAKLDARYLVPLARRRLAGGAATVPGTALRPIYLRPPDARLGAGASLLAAHA